MRAYLIALVLLCSILFTENLSGQCFTEQNFTTNGTHTFMLGGSVNDVFEIEIEAKGAEGGPYVQGNPISAGGEGATITARYFVSGQDVLTIFVGGHGVISGGSPSGGGGAGGSAVIINATDVLIAAAGGGGSGGGGATGGGGGQANTNSSPQGGAAPGASGGGGFNDAGDSGINSTGGGAGTLTTIGAGGNPGVVAGPGGSGFGGGGGGAGTVGGGGGGYQGGNGGGNSPQFGLGGDSFVNSGYSSSVVSAVAGLNGGANLNNPMDGYVKISCISVNGTVLEIIVDSHQDPSCANGTDGQIVVSGNGGTEPYEFSINGGAFSSNNVFTDLNAGTYTITIKDATTATAEVTVDLIDPIALNGSLIQKVDNLCFGDVNGIIEVLASGGTSSGTYLYALNNGPTQSSGLFQNLANGIYTITILDNNNCSIDLIYEISSPSSIDATVLTINVTCFGNSDGIIQIFATGGASNYEYSLDGINYQANNIFTNLAAGSYTCFVKDLNGCIFETTADLISPDELVISIDSLSGGCAGGANGIIIVSGEGGTTPYNYTLDDTLNSTSGTFLEVVPGAHKLVIIDNNDCVDSISVDLIISSEVAIQIDSTTNPSCGASDGAIFLSGNGGVEPYNFTLNDTINSGTGAFTELSSGTYYAELTDAEGCISVDTIMLMASGSPTLLLDSLIHITCYGNGDGSIQVSGTGGSMPYVFSLNDSINSSDGLFTNLTAGAYNAAITDTNGCSSQMQINLIEPDSISIDSLSIVNASCENIGNGSLIVQGSGGTAPLNYILGDSLSSIEGIFENLFGGNYSLQIIDANGCQSSFAINIDIIADLIILVQSVTNTSCGGSSDGAISVIGEGGDSPYSYMLNDSILSDSGLFENLISGTYNVEVIDSLGCSVSTEIIVESEQTFTVQQENISMVDCFGGQTGSIDFIIDGGTAGFNILLNGDTTILNSDEMFDFENLGAGNYTYVVEDASGCSTMGMFEIEQNDQILMVIDSILDFNCETNQLGFAQLSASGGTAPYLFIVANDSFSTGLFEELVPGNYEVEIVDGLGCSIQDSFSVGQMGSILIEFTVLEDISCFGFDDGSISLIPSDPNSSYTYTLAGESNMEGVFNGLAPGIHTVEISNDFGCIIAIIFELYEPEELSIQIQDFLPDDGSGSGSITTLADGGTMPYEYSIDGGITFQDSPVFNNLENGDFTILVVDDNGCEAEVFLSLTDIEVYALDQAEVIVSPNPSSGRFNIELIHENSLIEIDIYDIQGRLIQVYKNGHVKQIALDLSALNSGLYFMNIRTNRFNQIQKLIIE